MATELWGRMREAGAGKGEPGTSTAGGAKEKPLIKGKTLRGAN